jgi:sugar phosphate permease
LEGLRGWQWLFLLEGIPSVILGLSMRYVLPKDYHSAKFLNERQKGWLGEAMAAAAGAEAKEKSEHGGAVLSRNEMKLLREAVGNKRIWVVAFAGILKNAAMVGILFWAPLIVDALMEGGSIDIAAGAAAAAGSSSSGGGGHGAPVSKQNTEVLAVLLTSIPFISAACCAVLLGHHSERHKEKAHHVAVPYFAAGVLFISFPYAAAMSSKAAFICLTLAVTTLTAPNAILNSMASELGQGQAQALSLAVYNAVANLGGLIGPFMVGRLVQLTGVYSTAMQALGLCIVCAGSLAWYMKRWEGAAKVEHLAA